MTARLLRFPSPGLTNAVIRHDAGYERREVDQRLEVRRIGRAQDGVIWAAIVGFILALFGAWAGGGLR